MFLSLRHSQTGPVHSAAIELAAAVVGCVDTITQSPEPNDTTSVGVFSSVFALLRHVVGSIDGCGCELGEVLASVVLLWAERAPDACHTLPVANKVHSSLLHPCCFAVRSDLQFNS